MMNMAEDYDYLIKIMLIGDPGTGKNTLILNNASGYFAEDYKMTIGVDFHTKRIELKTSDGSKRCVLQIWVPTEQIRFKYLRSRYYLSALGVILLFDLTNHLTFDNLPIWIKEVKDALKYEVPILIAGNKCDLVDQRVVAKNEIDQFTHDNHLHYIEISAKTGEGVEESFQTLTRLMVEDINKKR
ncbi:MAG: GTP-binding protein, partial [Promethearchaeota archaeon]